jgi:hypothetical protein
MYNSFVFNFAVSPLTCLPQLHSDIWVYTILLNFIQMQMVFSTDGCVLTSTHLFDKFEQSNKQLSAEII